MPDNPHTQYSVQTHYFREEGELQIPVADDGEEECEIVRWSQPWGKKMVVWMAQSLGLPSLPDMNPQTSNEVLLDVQVSPVAPTSGPGGATLYTVSGIYTYALRRPPSKEEGYNCGGMPHGSPPALVNVLRQGQFKPGLR